MAMTHRPAAPPRAAVELRGITKRFPAVVANDGVDFEAAEGEVHALLGENGAGKSTLSNILTGLYRPDEGEIRLYGEPVEFHSPRDALDAGICMVHQHFRLVPPFTVAENVILGDHRGEGRKFLVHPRHIERRVAELGERYRIAVDPRARIWQLSLGEQQRVEILKALYREARILILDEPTAVLTPQEADVAVRDAADDGRRGPDGDLHLAQAARGEGRLGPRDRAARRARPSPPSRPPSSTPRSLAELMVGRELDVSRRRRARARAGRAGARARGRLGRRRPRRRRRARRHASTCAPARSSRSRASPATASASSPRSVAGMRPASRGQVEVARQAAARRRRARGDPRAASRTCRRTGSHTGVAPSLSIGSNVVLKAYRDRELAAGPLLRLGAIRDRAVDADRALRRARRRARSCRRGCSRAATCRRSCSAASSTGEPRVLVAASPTRGLDVSAIETVHAYLRDAARPAAWACS